MTLLPALVTLVLIGAPQGGAAKPVPKTDPAVVAFSLRWLRQDAPVAATDPVPEAKLLQAPNLSTTDGQVATLSWLSDGKSGLGDSFLLSLSPTVEPADNTTGGAEKKSGATVRTLWVLRVTDKTFPGGVSRIELSGASRLAVGGAEDAVIAQFGLLDPQTGRTTVYRLVGRASVQNSSTTGAKP